MTVFVNQAGVPVIEREIRVADATPDEAAKVFDLLLKHLNLTAVETNATAYGYTEIELRETP